jgi:CHAT domain-containing protein/Tfp pilus assembly protein PilF
MSTELRLACIAAAFILIAVPLSGAAATDWLAAGGRLITEGRPAAALIDLKSALEEFRRAPNAAGEAVALQLMAIAEVNLSNADLARSHFQSALRILRRWNDAIGTWLALVNLAQMERSVGNYGAALTWQDEAQRVIEKAEAQESPLTLTTFNLMASALGLPTINGSAAPTGAEEYLQAIVIEAIVKPLTHDGYAGILIEVGQYDRAEKELNAALAGTPVFAGGYEYSVAAHFGELRYRQHRFSEARAYYEKALQGSLRMPLNPLNEQWIKVGIHGRLAELEIAENHIEKALAWNDKSLATARSAQLPIESNILEERGLLLLQSDRLTEAETVLRQALAIAVASDNAPRRASIERDLADLSFLMGKYGAAIAHLEEAIRLQQILHQAANESLLWTNLAICYILISKDDAAETLLAHAGELAGNSQFELVRDVIAFLQTIQETRSGTSTKDDVRAAFRHLTENPQFTAMDVRGDAQRVLRESMLLDDATTPGANPENPTTLSIYTGLSYSNLGWRQLESGNTTTARQFFEKALNANSTGELRARYQAAIGACYWRDGNVEKAIQSFSEAAETLDTVVDGLRAESMLVSFLGSRDHRAYYDVLIEALLLNHHDEKAFEVSERARARGFLRAGNGQKTRPIGNRDRLAEKASEIRLLIERWESSQVPGETLENLRFRYDLLRSRVQSTTSEETSMNRVQPLSLTGIWQELPERTTLISYFISPIGAHAWVLDQERVEHVSLHLDPGEMKRVVCWASQFVKENRTTTTRRGVRKPSDCGSDSATSAEVYAMLFAPLRSRIHNSRLMIVPYGDLHFVPFAALYDPQRKHYLIEDYTLIYLPSASSMQLLRARESPVLGNSLVLGDPDSTGRTSLPGANLELQQVARMLGTNAKIGKEASEELLYNLEGKVDLLHIASHGRYDSADPLFSAIELAGSDKRNGHLTVDKILSDVDLSGVNLVVLSACQSGIGKLSGGDDVVGLPPAILYAGSPGVISTLWNISDKATTSLIERFYTRLLAGSTAADALRTAQLEMLNDPRFHSPYYWAAFVLTGDPKGNWATPSR